MHAKLSLRRMGMILAKAASISAGVVASPADAATCNVSPESVSFGSYDPLGASPADGVGTIAINCDTAATFTIGLSSGGSSYDGRRMSSGADRLDYNLYVDSNRSSIWGDGSGSTTTISDSSAGGHFTVYGRIPAGQNVPAGTYSDTITVTISY